MKGKSEGNPGPMADGLRGEQSDAKRTGVKPGEADPSETAAESTRDRLIEAARQLFWAKGYEATSISEILREAGVNSGSLYYFFKAKEALLLAVLDRYLELLNPEVIEPAFATTDDPIERIFAVLDGYRKMLAMTECRQGCPIGNLALEMSEKSDAVREKIALNFEGWRKAIRACLHDAADRFTTTVDLDQLSSFILTVMEGAVMQARAHRSLRPYEDAVTMLKDYMGRLVDQKVS